MLCACVFMKPSDLLEQEVAKWLERADCELWMVGGRSMGASMSSHHDQDFENETMLA